MVLNRTDLPHEAALKRRLCQYSHVFIYNMEELAALTLFALGPVPFMLYVSPLSCPCLST